MALEHLEAVSNFLEAMGIDTERLPVKRFVLDVSVEDVPKLTVQAMVYHANHVEALESLKTLSPNITVQFYDPRILPNGKSEDECPPTTYEHKTKVSIEEGCVDQPLPPFAEEVTDMVIPQGPKDELGGYSEAQVTFPEAVIDLNKE